MQCYVCQNDFAQMSQQSFNHIYTCNQCGNYILPGGDVPRLKDNLRFMISAYIREQQDKHKQFHLTQKIIDTIQNMIPPPIDEKVNKLMRWMEKQTSYAGESIPEIGKYPELTAICYAKNLNEVSYFLDYLKKKGYIEITSSNQNKITIEGLIFLESEKKNIHSDSCFCAMSFNEDHTYIYNEFIQLAAKEAGYKITRVDEDPHNSGVVDKIKALILQSKFVIADLTGHKNGVYYEAAWADRGGQAVIFTCEESDFENTHFDVQHLNLLKWSKNRLPEAIEKLKWRIEGTIGIGPYKDRNKL